MGSGTNIKGTRHVFVRQWELVRELAGKRYGLTVKQLRERLGTSKQTLYRDLATLRDAGIPLATSTSNGETRYRLLPGAELPARGLTSLQIAALHVARAQLEPFAGAAFVAELDALLAQLRPVERQESFQFAALPAGQPRVLKVVEQAIRTKRQARLEYRSVSRSGRASIVHVEPYLVRVAAGDGYFRAWCVERSAERTYKLARVANITLTAEPAAHVHRGTESETFSRAVKAWSGEPTTVRIVLEPSVAWLAGEYPLTGDQQVETHEDGRVTIQANVAGVVETAKWVLSWGGHAEALAPAELRSLVRGELAKALHKYGAAAPAKAKPRTESPRRTSRLTQGGTARS